MVKLTQHQKRSIIAVFLLLLCAIAMIAVFTGDASLIQAGTFITTVIGALITIDFIDKKQKKKRENGN